MATYQDGNDLWMNDKIKTNKQSFGLKMSYKSLAATVLATLFIISCSSTGTNRRALHPGENRRESLRKNIRDNSSIYALRGKASYYGTKFHGRKTANGEVYNMYALTAAHRELPFGTLCRITNMKNGKSVIVKINDRGPFVPDRIFDLSYGAAQELGAIADGVIEIKAEILKLGAEKK